MIHGSFNGNDGVGWDGRGTHRTASEISAPEFGPLASFGRSAASPQKNPVIGPLFNGRNGERSLHTETAPCAMRLGFLRMCGPDKASNIRLICSPSLLCGRGCGLFIRDIIMDRLQRHTTRTLSEKMQKLVTHRGGKMTNCYPLPLE